MAAERVEAEVVPISDQVDLDSYADGDDASFVVQQKIQQLYGMALEGASWRAQVQMRDEIFALIATRAVGEVALHEVAELTEFAQRKGLQIAMSMAIFLDGLRGKVDPDAMDVIRQIGMNGLAQVQQIHQDASENITGRSRRFRLPTRNADLGDVIYHGLRGTLPSQQLGCRKGGW
jgi:hypothetical protein